MRMHLGHQHMHVPPDLYDRADTEAAGDAFAIDERVADEEVVASLDLASALIHRREGRTVHGHT